MSKAFVYNGLWAKTQAGIGICGAARGLQGFHRTMRRGMFCDVRAFTTADGIVKADAVCFVFTVNIV